MAMDLRGKVVIVVGLGRSGVAAARLCLGQGAGVMGTDSRPASELRDDVRELGIQVFTGGHDEVPFESADLVVVSPGVPGFPALERAAAAGVAVVGEIELASWFARGPIVAVGGTNGKSTVTTAVSALLEATGRRVFSGGNLGTPFADAVFGDFEVFVVEVSSFQMERAPTFHPKAAVLLNVTEDHLDRYPSLEAYAAAKGNAFVNQTPDDVAVVPANDAVCAGQAARGRGRVVTFGAVGRAAPGGAPPDYMVEGTDIVERATGTRFPLSGSDFHGAHNHSNAAAAVAVARTFGLDAGAIGSGLGQFKSLGHRMSLVAEIDGVRFYDDSKATNVGAAVTALFGLSEPRAVLIAGGRDKLGSYEPLVSVLEKKGRAVVLIGEAADRIEQAVGRSVPVARASTMDEAVERARALAKPGDAVLLSPACSSFDMFQSYADRGDRFASAVKTIQARRAS
jgi:UDP-N-acetylmuramoylalanine--D-glutamate ligase